MLVTKNLLSATDAYCGRSSKSRGQAVPLRGPQASLFPQSIDWLRNTGTVIDYFLRFLRLAGIEILELMDIVILVSRPGRIRLGILLPRIIPPGNILDHRIVFVDLEVQPSSMQ